MVKVFPCSLFPAILPDPVFTTDFRTFAPVIVINPSIHFKVKNVPHFVRDSNSGLKFPTFQI